MLNKISNIINITNNAWYKIFNISQKLNRNNFLLSVSSGGCNGYNYNLKSIHNEKYKKILLDSKIDITILKKNNSSILIDPKSELLLIGTTIDYISENLSKGIYENKFVFIPNKQTTISCGCGTSFYPK